MPDFMRVVQSPALGEMGYGLKLMAARGMTVFMLMSNMEVGFFWTNLVTSLSVLKCLGFALLARLDLIIMLLGWFEYLS